MAGTGFTHFDGTVWTVYGDNTEGLYTNNKVDIAIAPNGNPWVAIDGSTMMGKAGSVLTFDGTEWLTVRELSCESKAIPFTQTHFCPGFSGLAVDENGNVWAGGNDGLEKYDGDQWTTFPEPEIFGGRVLFYRENKIWALYEKAIWAFDPQTETWTSQIDLESSIRYSSVKDFQFDGRGRLWLAANDGLYVYDSSGWIRFDTEETGLAGNLFDEIVVFGNGPALTR
jgi:streptogramin lyase